MIEEFLTYFILGFFLWLIYKDRQQQYQLIQNKFKITRVHFINHTKIGKVCIQEPVIDDDGMAVYRLGDINILISRQDNGKKVKVFVENVLPKQQRKSKVKTTKSSKVAKAV